MALTDVHLGPCSITYDGNDLGRSAGGVTFTYTPTFVDFTADQYTMKETTFLTGEACTATVPLAETGPTNLSYVFTQGTLTTSGDDERLDFGGDTISTSDLAELVLEPSWETDDNQKITIFKALCQETFEIGYNKESVKTIAAVFHGYRDSSKSAGYQLFCFGDTDVAT